MSRFYSSCSFKCTLTRRKLQSSLTACAPSRKRLGSARASVVSKDIMRCWIILFLVVSLAASAFGRLGDDENQLRARYGKPVSAHPGGKYNPYFDKLIDFQKEGIAISCGLHAGRCVTIQYARETGFNTLEFEGFTLLNQVGPPVFVQRSATSLKGRSRVFERCDKMWVRSSIRTKNPEEIISSPICQGIPFETD
jgi:hypothetical protein